MLTVVFYGKYKNSLDEILIAMSLIKNQKVRKEIEQVKRQSRILPFERISAGLIIIDLCLIFFLCVMVPPNNWDSMTYHLPRMESWFQNGSLFQLVSQIDRQTWNPQLAESFLLLPRALTTVDIFFNLLQLGSLVIIILIFFGMSKALHVSPLIRNLGILAILSWPTVLLEATTTQNDLVAALFTIICWVFLILSNKHKDTVLLHVLFGLSAALAIAVKGSSVLFGFLACLVYLINSIQQRRSLIQISKTLIFPLILNSALWMQNYVIFRSLFSPPSKPEYNAFVTNYSPITFLENFFRLIAMNLALPINSWMSSLHFNFDSFFDFFNLSKNNPANTWSGGFVIPVGAHEDIASSPALVLVILLIVWTLFKRPKVPISSRQELLVMTLPIAYFIIFVYILRNQPWINRLLVPSFILLCFYLFLYQPNLKKIQVKYIALPTVALFIYSSSFLFFAADKPLLSSFSIFSKSKQETLLNLSDEAKLFTNRPNIGAQYWFQLQKINSKNFESVYLNLGSDDWEYPTWHFFKGSDRKPLIYSYLNSRNIQAKGAQLCIGVADCPASTRMLESFSVMPDSSITPRNIFSLNKDYFFNEDNPIPAGEGWSIPEKWGTWSDGLISKIPFVIGGTTIPKTGTIELLLKPYLPLSTSKLAMSLELNGKEIEKFVFTKEKEYLFKAKFTAQEYFNAVTIPNLTFKIANPKSPAAFGNLADNRSLGIGLVMLRISSN
jgi:hypothetical protein